MIEKGGRKNKVIEQGGRKNKVIEQGGRKKHSDRETTDLINGKHSRADHI